MKGFRSDECKKLFPEKSEIRTGGVTSRSYKHQLSACFQQGCRYCHEQCIDIGLPMHHRCGIAGTWVVFGYLEIRRIGDCYIKRLFKADDLGKCRLQII